MDMTKILSGSELVARGVTKTNATLPDSGQKDISSSGSWLESKQIQSALEARRHLLEVERIEKLGSLSVAIWREDLKLAEVTKKAGGYWQYIGHNVGKHLYLRAEEALYLIEINCLYLKHNEVVVSLQKAYTLCLQEINLTQYKVYASLSRLGYRVFRHRDSPLAHSQQQAMLNMLVNQETTENIGNECDKNQSDLNTGDQEPVLDKNGCNNQRLIPVIPSSKSTLQEKFNFRDTESTTHSVTNAKPSSSIVETASLNKKTAIVMGYSPINSSNIESSTIVEETNSNLQGNIGNNTEQVSSTALSGNKDHNTDTKNDGDANYKENNNQQNTVIVTAKCKDNMDTRNSINATNSQESNTHDVESIIDKNSNDKSADLNRVAIPNEQNTANNEMKVINENMDSGGPTVIVSAKSNSNNVNAIRGVSTGGNKHYVMKNIKTIAGNLNFTPNGTSNSSEIERPDIIYSVDEIGVIRVLEQDNQMETDDDVGTVTENNKEDGASTCQNNLLDHLKMFMMDKIQKLHERRRKPTQHVNANQIKLPDCFDRKIITVNSPHVQYLPRNIFLMKTDYLIDLEAIKRLNSKTRKDSNTESLDSECSINEARHLPVAGASVNRINTNFAGQQRISQHSNMNPMFPIFPPYFTPPIWTARHMTQPQYHQYNRPRYPIYRPNINLNFNINPNCNARKRGNPRFKSYHLRVIRNLAERFKVFAPSQIQDLVRLVNTFNEQYDERYELTNDFKLVDLNEVPEVIVLDDDGEPKPKKARPNNDNENINKHLDKLKSLAAKLKHLETMKLAISRHRRVLSNAIKAFNKHFDADIYLNSNFEIIDSKLITLDSSSDSDSVVAVEDQSMKRKKLRNPFSILKNSWRNDEGASTSREVPILRQLSLNVINEGFTPGKTDVVSGEGLLKYFHRAWLPDDDDFGRAEVCSREKAHFFAVTEAEYLYNYFKYRSREFENWLELKIALLERVQMKIETWKERALNDEVFMETDYRMQPLVAQDCTDTMSVLQKLQIIQTSVEATTNSCRNTIEVDFDVYYGNSPSFKKANRPKPNFRVLCIDVSEDFLSSQYIDGLCSKYSQDKVPLIIGAVGVGSISYVQISNSEIPVYIPDNFL